MVVSWGSPLRAVGAMITEQTEKKKENNQIQGTSAHISFFTLQTLLRKKKFTYPHTNTRRTQNENTKINIEIHNSGYRIMYCVEFTKKYMRTKVVITKADIDTLSNKNHSFFLPRLTAHMAAAAAGGPPTTAETQTMSLAEGSEQALRDLAPIALDDYFLDANGPLFPPAENPLIDGVNTYPSSAVNENAARRLGYWPNTASHESILSYNLAHAPSRITDGRLLHEAISRSMSFFTLRNQGVHNVTRWDTTPAPGTISFHYTFFPATRVVRKKGTPYVTIDTISYIVVYHSAPMPGLHGMGLGPDRQVIRPDYFEYRMGSSVIHVDTALIGDKSCQASVAAAIETMRPTPGWYITILPAVPGDEANKVMDAVSGKSNDPFVRETIFRLSGASLGLAVAAAIGGLPSIHYTGYLTDFGPTSTTGPNAFSQYRRLGPDGLMATLPDIGLVSNPDDVWIKAAHLARYSLPFCLPATSANNQSLRALLAKATDFRERIQMQRNPLYLQLMETAVSIPELEGGRNFFHRASTLLFVRTLSDCAILGSLAQVAFQGYTLRRETHYQGNASPSAIKAIIEERKVLPTLIAATAKKRGAAQHAKVVRHMTLDQQQKYRTAQINRKKDQVIGRSTFKADAAARRKIAKVDARITARKNNQPIPKQISKRSAAISAAFFPGRALGAAKRAAKKKEGVRMSYQPHLGMHTGMAAGPLSEHQMNMQAQVERLLRSVGIGAADAADAAAEVQQEVQQGVPPDQAVQDVVPNLPPEVADAVADAAAAAAAGAEGRPAPLKQRRLGETRAAAVQLNRPRETEGVVRLGKFPRQNWEDEVDQAQAAAGAEPTGLGPADESESQAAGRFRGASGRNFKSWGFFSALKNLGKKALGDVGDVAKDVAGAAVGAAGQAALKRIASRFA